tara:strand:+ start:908 stop:1141 length:234 start_codon:yes stop_codon:yes gene_type:complete
MPIVTKEDQIRALSRLKTEDKEELKYIVDRLQKVIDSSKVSEESITEMHRVISLLLSLHNKFVSYNIMWLKQGFMED